MLRKTPYRRLKANLDLRPDLVRQASRARLRIRVAEVGKTANNVSHVDARVLLFERLEQTGKVFVALKENVKVPKVSSRSSLRDSVELHASKVQL